MPNGGSDCCGTCWFNSANEGKPGYREGPPPRKVRCTIRGLEIEVPIGPVYVTDDYPYKSVTVVFNGGNAERARKVICLDHPTATLQL